jgi:hypothetical protein
MGIHTRKGGPRMFSKPGTAIPRQLVTQQQLTKHTASWAEAEERRRVWCAVIVLYRYYLEAVLVPPIY